LARFFIVRLFVLSRDWLWDNVSSDSLWSLMSMRVLVTGGAGYIGSHACVALLSAGHDIVVLDNYSNSSPVSLQRVEQICGETFPVIEADVGDRRALDELFGAYDIDAVMHFAGLKAVGESCVEPLSYYHNNVGAAVTLLQAMRAADVNTFIFSSSATVYGEPASNPITEDFPLKVTNPYGRTKLVVEDMLRDLAQADVLSGNRFWRVALLRAISIRWAPTSAV
jgi:UDP-glucose 4-epimerase